MRVPEGNVDTNTRRNEDAVNNIRYDNNTDNADNEDNNDNIHYHYYN